MARTTQRSRRKASGGRYTDYRKKRVFEGAGNPVLTEIGETAIRQRRVKGGNIKQKLLKSNIINLTDKKGKAVKATFDNVVENQANMHFIRRNIITKGCIVETSKGKARVTSRPGQEGTINGVLV